MNIYSAVAAAVCISFVALSVKSVNKETGQVISLVSVVFMISLVMPQIVSIIREMRVFAAESAGGEKYIEPIVKITGIAYISQIGAQLCEENGEKALAGRVEAAGKIAICSLALPIAKEAFFKIMGIL